MRTATCTVDATNLRSTCDDPDSDDYIETPLVGRLILIMNQGNQRDVRSFGVTKDDYIVPINLSSTVLAFIFQSLGWDGDSKSNDPNEYCLFDTVANSGGGIDCWCMEGESREFDLDIDPESPSYGKILPRPPVAPVVPVTPVVPKGYDGVAMAVKTSWHEPTVTVRRRPRS
jgi:hypothetical protein